MRPVVATVIVLFSGLGDTQLVGVTVSVAADETPIGLNVTAFAAVKLRLFTGAYVWMIVSADVRSPSPLVSTNTIQPFDQFGVVGQED